MDEIKSGLEVTVICAGSESEFDSFVRQHLDECYDDDGEFDWDAYQELCDIAEYWDME